MGLWNEGLITERHRVEGGVAVSGRYGGDKQLERGEKKKGLRRKLRHAKEKGLKRFRERGGATAVRNAVRNTKISWSRS